MGKSGRCGLISSDSYLATVLSTMVYVPTENAWGDRLVALGFGGTTSRLSLLPSHARIPDHPPRTRL